MDPIKQCQGVMIKQLDILFQQGAQNSIQMSEKLMQTILFLAAYKTVIIGHY